MLTVYCSLSVCLEIVPRCCLASLVVNMKGGDPNLLVQQYVRVETSGKKLPSNRVKPLHGKHMNLL